MGWHDYRGEKLGQGPHPAMFWRVCRIFFASQKERIRPMLVYNQGGKITNREFLRGMVSTKRKRADRRRRKLSILMHLIWRNNLHLKAGGSEVGGGVRTTARVRA